MERGEIKLKETVNINKTTEEDKRRVSSKEQGLNQR